MGAQRASTNPAWQLRGGRWRALVALCALLGAYPTCDAPGAEPEPGAILLQWRISPQGCAPSGVHQVQALISGPAEPSWSELLFECDAGHALIHDLPPGRYDVYLQGRDALGKAIFESVPQNIGVSRDTTTTPEPVRLSAKRAAINVHWSFENGNLCERNEITDVFIGAYDENAFSLTEDLFPCQASVGRMEALPSGIVQLEVLAMTAHGEARFRAFSPIQLERGERADVEVKLQTCADDC